MKKTAILLGALAIGAAMPAFAHDETTGEGLTRYYFYKMDTDTNGYISRPEHESFAAGMFTRADTNRDGFLTYNEILAHKKSEWDDYKSHFETRSGAYYEGDKYYPYGKAAPTRTPNEPFKANRGKDDRAPEYDIRKNNDGAND